MIKNRHWIAVTVVCAICACMLGACSTHHREEVVIYETEKENQREDVKITFFGYKADAHNLLGIENALHSFMEKNSDILVKYEGIKGTKYWEIFSRRVDSGYMDDIIMINHDSLLALEGEGKLADLSGLETIDNFSEMAKSQFVNSDGSVYFLPTCISTYGLYVNYDLLEAHGQKVPTNLAEFQEVCNYFLQQGVTPITANNDTSLQSLILAKAMYPIYQMEDSAAEIERFNSGEADLAETLRPGVELVGEMINNGWFDCEELLNTKQPFDGLEIFTQGERPFMITENSDSSRVKSMNPDLHYGIHPYPILENGSVLVINVDTCISVNAESEHLKEALDFVLYLTQPEMLWNYCDRQSSFSPIKEKKVPSDKAIAPCVEYMTNGQNVIGSDYRLNLSLEASLTECTKQMLKGMEVQETVRLLQKLLTEGMPEE